MSNKFDHYVKFNFVIILCVICIFIGIGLRSARLMSQVVWHDEAHTILRASGVTTEAFTGAMFDGKLHTASELRCYQQLTPGKTFTDTLRALASHPEHSPLYFLLVRLAAPYFDSPIVAARLLSVVGGLLLLPALFLLAEALFPQSKIAPFTALCVTALAPIQVLYAREARQYALLEVFVALSIYQLMQAFQKDRGWGWYGLWVALGLYTHLIFSVVIAAHLCFMAVNLRDRVRWQKFSASLLGAVGCFSPWAWVALNRVTEFKQHTAWMYIPISYQALVSGWMRHLDHILFDLPDIPVLPWIAALLVLICLCLTLYRSDGKTGWMLGLIIGFNTLPIIIPDLLTGGQRSMEGRYFLPAILSLQLCVAFGLAYLIEHSSGRRWVGYGLFFGMLTGTVLFGYRYLNADTWWNKKCSKDNPTFAHLVNSSVKPLIVTDVAATSPGEVLSLSYLIRPQTFFLLLPNAHLRPLPEGCELFLFKASYELERALRRRYAIVAVAQFKGIYRIQTATSKRRGTGRECLRKENLSSIGVQGVPSRS